LERAQRAVGFMGYYSIEQQRLVYSKKSPFGMKPLKHNLALLLPPLIGTLHTSFRAWSLAGYSPGPITPNRVYFNEQGKIAFEFYDAYRPLPLWQGGAGPDLAAWFVLLDKWMETYVIIARARMVWTLPELASALAFLTPAFLPTRLAAHPPNDNWERVAVALSITLADGALRGSPTDRHWQRALS